MPARCACHSAGTLLRTSGSNASSPSREAMHAFTTSGASRTNCATRLACPRSMPSAAAISVIVRYRPVTASVQQGRLQRDIITVDKGHGRVETRCCVVANDLSTIESQLKCWPGVRSVVMVESTRQIVNGRDKGEPTTEWRYYISSLDVAALEFNRRIREHWAIENKCHWVLDVALKEDACRVRCGHGAACGPSAWPSSSAAAAFAASALSNCFEW